MIQFLSPSAARRRGWRRFNKEVTRPRGRIHHRPREANHHHHRRECDRRTHSRGQEPGAQHRRRRRPTTPSPPSPPPTCRSLRYLREANHHHRRIRRRRTPYPSPARARLDASAPSASSAIHATTKHRPPLTGQPYFLRFSTHIILHLPHHETDLDLDDSTPAFLRRPSAQPGVAPWRSTTTTAAPHTLLPKPWE